MGDILVFLWAVINNWAGYFTGGLLAASVAFWAIWEDKPVPRNSGLMLAGVFLIMAFYKAWQEQLNKVRERDALISKQNKIIEQLNPELATSIDALSVGTAPMVSNEGTKSYAYFMLVVTIRNTGAPSIADRFTFRVTFTDGSTAEGFITALPANWKIDYHTGQSELISDTEALDVRTLRPIERGGKAVGRLLFVFMDAQEDQLKQHTKEVELRFFDTWGKEHHIVEKPGGLSTNIQAFPGLSQPMRKGEEGLADS